jgi:hypothetical protein
MNLLKIILLIILTNILFIGSKERVTDIPNYAFKSGERLKYLAYYGIIDGGEALLTIKEIDAGDKMVLHAVATAKSVGIVDKLYNVKDTYESYMDIKTGLPIKAIRNIKEDTYLYYDEVVFNREDNTIVSKRKGKQSVPVDILDMVSAFYYARRVLFKNVVPGKIIELNTYFDDSIYPLKVRYIGPDIIKTKIGRVYCMKFSPVVEAGRIFDTENDLTIWISNDNNYIPVRVRMDFIVGSVKCDLVEYSGLKNNLAIIR